MPAVGLELCFEMDNGTLWLEFGSGFDVAVGAPFVLNARRGGKAMAFLRCSADMIWMGFKYMTGAGCCFELVSRGTLKVLLPKALGLCGRGMVLCGVGSMSAAVCGFSRDFLFPFMEKLLFQAGSVEFLGTVNAFRSVKAFGMSLTVLPRTCTVGD